ncbi:hypothetical protein A2U01_0040754 [Trifolium medium]|uniref:Uncharacterized protein n=1 Tax=Trifolium medium TaxID=97028 RepID=A0A392Q7S2_9FABA|nr:hypothetical protein [Trifolium medium]
MLVAKTFGSLSRHLGDTSEIAFGPVGRSSQHTAFKYYRNVASILHP